MSEYSKQVSETLLFRKAGLADLHAISDILKQAVTRMLAEGKCQWNENYPNAAHVRADIENGVGYVLESEGQVVGYGAVVFTGEPAYKDLTGQWLTDGEYVVVHRLAVNREAKEKGLGRAFMLTVEDFAEEESVPSFRVDTNFDNDVMLALLHRLGFTHCGDIRYQSGPRLAFEKKLDSSHKSKRQLAK